ncbi:MAG: twin-arginine translocation signal domain-containing protein [Cyclobacteriaceae bacterium]
MKQKDKHSMEAGLTVIRNSRREFLKNSAALATLATTGPLAGFSELHAQRPTAASMINGIQVGAVSFVDEGVEKVLDTLQKRGGVNTIFLTTFTYGRGLSGRQIPGHPFPDHGSQESDDKTFHGGNYATPHAGFYQKTILKKTRATEHGNLDIVAAVLPAAKKRGMKVFCSVEDQWRSDVPGVNECAEIDLQGRKARTLCLFKSDVREFWTGLVTDLCKSYDIDGILFFNERNGPLLTALGASHFQTIDSSRVTCFCEDHERAAREHGINFDRAKEGYQKLDQFVQASLKDQRPSDGYYVEFQRLLVKYPEIVAYDQLFDFAKHQVLKEVNASVKAVDKNLQVGFHIEHVNSFNPFFRATRSYEELATMADFLKVVAYNNCGGERYARFIRNIGSTIFRDVPQEELWRFNNHLLGYGKDEASLDNLPKAGLSADYVFRETKRAIEGVKGKMLILPGIDIGIPTDTGSRKASPEDTYAATLAAYKAGANGVILSRKYSEMSLANLDAAGRAVRDGT